MNYNKVTFWLGGGGTQKENSLELLLPAEQNLFTFTRISMPRFQVCMLFQKKKIRIILNIICALLPAVRIRFRRQSWKGLNSCSAFPRKINAFNKIMRTPQWTTIKLHSDFAVEAHKKKTATNRLHSFGKKTTQQQKQNESSSSFLLLRRTVYPQLSCIGLAHWEPEPDLQDLLWQSH